MMVVTRGRARMPSGIREILKKWFSRSTVDSVPPASSVPQSSEHLHTSVLSIRYENREQEDFSDGSDPQYRQEPAQFTDPLWRMGWTDGRANHPLDRGVATVAAESEFELDRQAKDAQDKANELRSSLPALEQERTHLQVLVTGIAAALEDQLARQRENSMAFSRPFGIFFLAVAIGITVSDVPLSLNLVASSFHLPNEQYFKVQGATWTAVDPSAPLPPNPVRVGASDLLVHPLLVLQYLWEPWVLALGIALCGFFFKLFLEQVGDWGKIPGLSDRQKRGLRWAIPVIYVAMIVSVVWTYDQLADLRAKQQALQSVLNEQQDLNAKLAAAAAGADTTKLRAAIDALQAREQELRPAVELRASSAFFWLTVVLPIVAGAFLSAGSQTLARCGSLVLLRKQVDDSTARLLATSTQIGKYKGQADAITDFVTKVICAPDYRQRFVARRVEVYRHGYLRGRLVPETVMPKAGPHGWCEREFRRFLGERLR